MSTVPISKGCLVLICENRNHWFLFTLKMTLDHQASYVGCERTNGHVPRVYKFHRRGEGQSFKPKHHSHKWTSQLDQEHLVNGVGKNRVMDFKEVSWEELGRRVVYSRTNFKLVQELRTCLQKVRGKVYIFFFP